MTENSEKANGDSFAFDYYLWKFLLLLSPLTPLKIHLIHAFDQASPQEGKTQNFTKGQNCGGVVFFFFGSSLQLVLLILLTHLKLYTAIDFLAINL